VGAREGHQPGYNSRKSDKVWHKLVMGLGWVVTGCESVWQLWVPGKVTSLGTTAESVTACDIGC
jgi:hypothetical protein